MTTTLLEKEVINKPKTKKPDKREAIVEAARVLFTTEGYETTTIADVAKKAGVAVGTVYLYFKNKMEILAGAQGDWELEYMQALSNPALQQIPHHLRARPMIEASFAMCSQQAEMVQLMGLQMQQVGDFHKNDKGIVVQAVKSFLDEGIALGRLRPIDTEYVAVIVFGMVDAALHQCFSRENGQNQERYINALVDALEHWLTPNDFKQVK